MSEKTNKLAFVDKISDFLIPVAEKMQTFHLITALTATMQANMPVTIIGSFACLIAFLDLGGWQAFLAEHSAISMICMSIQSMTLSIFAFYVLVLLPYLYATNLKMKQAVAMIPMTVAAYFLLTPHQLYTAINCEWFGHKGLISVILVSFVVVRVTKLLIDNKIYIKMPAGIPKFVEDGFAILVPAAIIFVGFAIIQYVMAGTSFGTVHNVIYTVLQKPFQLVGLSMLGQAVTETCAALAMFLGLHAMTVVGIVEPIRSAASLENLAAWQAGTAIPNVVCGGFTSLSLIGAGGSCFSVTLSFLLFAKSERYKQISRMAAVPGFFGVGEPILFGLPIMLNPLAFIPFIFNVFFNQIYSYLVIASGLVGKFNGVSLSWTVPNILSVALANTTPVRAEIALFIELAVNLLVWYPFVKIMDKQALAEEAAAKQAS